MTIAPALRGSWQRARAFTLLQVPVAALLAVSALVPASLAAQGAPAARTQPDTAADRAAVLAVVTRLFDGMRAGDSAMVRSVFHPSASLSTAGARGGAPGISVDPLDAFVKAVGTPHTEQWDERVYAPVVHLDGHLAVVWAEYSFFAGGTFSHCGTDAMQLVRLPEGWKIVALADTRRRTGCRTS